MEEELVKISELEPVDTLYDGCCMPLVQYGETKKVTYDTLKSKLNDDLDFVKNTDDLEERITELQEIEYEQDEQLEDLRAGVRSKQAKLTAGANITIDDDNVISASGELSSNWGSIAGTLSDQTDLQDELDNKQDTLISGENIKTVNNQSLLGSGNIDIQGGSGTSDFDNLTNRPKYNNQTMDHNTEIPIVPTKTSDLTNDSDFISEIINNVNDTNGSVTIGKIGIEWGMVEVTPSSGSSGNYYGSTSVTFENDYKYAPVVMATAAGGYTTINNISATGVTTNGCNIWMSATSNAARNVRWLAIGQIN